MKEKRQYIRVGTSTPVLIKQEGEDVYGLIVDISIHGMGVVIPHAFEVGDHVDTDFQLGDDEIFVKGEIVNKRGIGEVTVYGIEFKSPEIIETHYIARKYQKHFQNRLQYG